MLFNITTCKNNITTCILENAKMIIPIECLIVFIQYSCRSSCQYSLCILSQVLSTQLFHYSIHDSSTFSSWHHVTIVFTVRVTFLLQSLRNISCKTNIELTLIVWLRSWIVGTWLNCNDTVGARRASHSPSVITVSVPMPKRYCQCVGVAHAL